MAVSGRNEEKNQEKRIEKLQQQIGEYGLDGMLVTGDANRRYLSGFDGSFGFLLIPSEGQGDLVTDFRYLEQAEEQTPHLQKVKYEGELGRTVARLADEKGWTRLGIEEEHLSYQRFRELRGYFEGELAPLQKIVESLRAVKDAGELEKIRSSAALLDDAYQHLKALLQPGVAEREVALELEYYLRKKGAGGPTFPYIVASGERGAMPHGAASEKVLREGEVITVDFGVYYQGYASDMTRNFALGEPPSLLKELYRIAEKAQQQALEGIRPYMTGKEADALAREVIEEAGYGEYFGHGLGHGVGLAPHEQPTLSPRSQEMLEPGNVVTVEPGIYVPALGGIRLEDMVVVGEEGVELLTHSPRELAFL